MQVITRWMAALAIVISIVVLVALIAVDPIALVRESPATKESAPVLAI